MVPFATGFSYTITSVAAYDDFAWFYNRYWNEEFHSLAFPILERIWLPRLPAGARILDVCCGTGYLAGLLTARGYRVSGFDASAEMIGYARQNVPQAEFEVSDAAAFRAKALFEGAVSTFDSLNHIVEKRELQAAFGNVACALRPGASFAFDMLLEEAYQTHWGEAFALVREDHVLTITGSGYDFRSHIASCTITMFRLIEDAWRRSDCVVRERCYTMDEIGEAISAAEFAQLECYDARDLGMGGQLGEGRTLFVAQK
ncbi:MAG: methyltransferase domain-containing protein [Acidobacteriia bacterium]|nr:methyltransferase domain-containing protein [Terriglobia bacterium]